MWRLEKLAKVSAEVLDQHFERAIELTSERGETQLTTTLLPGLEMVLTRVFAPNQAPMNEAPNLNR